MIKYEDLKRDNKWHRYYIIYINGETKVVID